MTHDELIEAVVEYYLTSGDYNGLPARQLKGPLVPDLGTLKALLRALVEQGALSVNFGDTHPNPHIRALAEASIEEQLAKIDAAPDEEFVIYPTARTLQPRVDRSQYSDRPFSLRLALGTPQLEVVSFDLAVIDHYRRDPRYDLWTNDVQATLSTTDGAFLDPQFPEKHKVLIQGFGFSYTPALERAVAVFLTDLGGLTPEHQQIWAAYEVQGDYRMHPDFYRAAIMGDWELKASLSEAFVEELRVINAMCTAIGWPTLFRNVFEKPPRDLALLVRPTVSEYEAFVLVLDKLLSDNINVQFFPPTVPREQEEERPDGKVVVRQRGSLAMLDDWLHRSFRTRDPGPLDEMLATFREIRTLRQKPAHALHPDAHDPSLFEKQRELFNRAYDALRTLRLILQNHPRARAIAESMDPRVREGAIWSH